MLPAAAGLSEPVARIERHIDPQGDLIMNVSTIAAQETPRRRSASIVGVGLATLALCSVFGTATASAQGHGHDRGSKWGPKITAAVAADASQDAIDEYFDDEATTTSMKCKKKTRTRALCTARVTADGDLYLVRTQARSFYNEDDERDAEARVLRARDMGPAPEPEAPTTTETTETAPEAPAAPPAAAPAPAKGDDNSNNNNNIVVVVNGRYF
jgi:hypothetical protein